MTNEVVAWLIKHKEVIKDLAIPGAALFVSIAAFVVGFVAIRLSAKQARAQTLAYYLEKYAAVEMKEALILLGDWEKRYSDQLRETWLTGDKDEAKSAWENIKDEYEREKIDSARRLVHWFYKSAWRLYKLRYFNKETMAVIAETNGYPLFFRIIWPLTNLIHVGKMQKSADTRFVWIKMMEVEFKPEHYEG